MDDFKKEASKLSTEDLLLILSDQTDLYTEEEIQILRDEFDHRPNKDMELQWNREKLKFEQEIQEEQEKQRRAEQEKQRRKEQAEYNRQVFEQKIENLKNNGYDGYYEYTTISLVDNSGGSLSAEQLSKTLNDYSLDGWRLVSAYTNELGHNSRSAGLIGFSMGTNSTIDQHIIVLERFVKI